MKKKSLIEEIKIKNMAIGRRVKAGWIVVSEGSNEPLINRVFRSRDLALQFAAQYGPGNY